MGSKFTPQRQPQTCYACGKRTPKLTETKQLWDGAEYTGNLKTIRRAVSGRVVTLTLWDGVSYESLPYGENKFCRLRCAEHFATAAVNAGYRMKKKTVA
jgi:hypothetical protein